jgi:hypothetical protein
VGLLAFTIPHFAGYSNGGHLHNSGGTPTLPAATLGSARRDMGAVAGNADIALVSGDYNAAPIPAGIGPAEADYGYLANGGACDGNDVKWLPDDNH